MGANHLAGGQMPITMTVAKPLGEPVPDFLLTMPL